ncbi:uncharacterized protein LOC143293682 isoform X2 [Babylonia areolata]|uniref:uncharacterized protein LOC143293682 isoform X2 n=1 Tax=Babylonia areolata TaxID=304850 RepID=UPI003FD16938
MKKSKRLLTPTDSKIKAVPSTSSGLKKDGGKSQQKLAGKVIFLDVKDEARARTIQLKLKKLNAVIETFLSKDVHYVVSSSDSCKSKSQTRCQGHASPALSNTPSPFHFTPSATPSPTYRNAQGKLVPLSRGQAMAQMARARNRSPSPSSVIASAGKLGIKVIYVDAAERWLDRELKRYGLTISEESSSPQDTLVKRPNSLSKTRQLLEPFLKVESTTKQYRPQHKELTTWPHINLKTPSATCPFDGIGVTPTHRSKGAGKEAAASAGHALTPSTQSNATQRRSLEADDTSRLVGVPILTAGDLRRQQEKRKQEQRRRGYCECCHTRYDDIEKHLKEPGHVEFARDKNNYEALDELMSLLPSAGEFLRNTLLRHCSEQQGDKPSASASDQDGESSDDPVLTISNSTSPETPHPHVPDAPAAPETGLEVAGYQTPTYTPQYPVGYSVSILGSSASNQDQQTVAGDQQMSQAAASSWGTDADPESRTRDQGLLPAVVIRRPGARSAYGSPRDKWSQGHSPYRRESPQTPKKVRERSMVFGNTSIGSLQSVPEDQSLAARMMPEYSERQGGQSAELSASKTSFKEHASFGALSQSVSEEELPAYSAQKSAGRGTPKTSLQRAFSLKRKRGSLEVEESDNEMVSTTSKQPSQESEFREDENESEKFSQADLKNQNDRKKRSSHKRGHESGHQKLLSSENRELEKVSFETEDKELQGKHDDIIEPEKENEDRVLEPGLKGELDTLSPSLPRCPRKQQQRFPGKRDSGLDGPIPGEIQLPQKQEQQTPKKAVSRLVMEEEELGSSPVYMPQDVASSTPMLVVVRKLRSTRSGIVPLPEEDWPPAAKSSRRSLLTEYSQPGPSNASSAEGEVLGSVDIEISASRGRKDMTSRNNESLSGTKGSSTLRKREGSASGNTEKSASRIEESKATGNEETSASESKKSVSGSKETVAPGSEERSGLRSRRSASGTKEASVWGSEDRSASCSKERSEKRETLASGSKRSASPVSTTNKGRTTRQRSNPKRTSTRHSSSKETTREGGIFNSFSKSSDSCFTDDSSRQSAHTSASNYSGQSVDSAWKDPAPTLRVTLVRCPYSPPEQSSTKKVKLNRSWQLLSDNSMSRLLRSETEASSFDGFHGDEALPSDLTYVSASEVEVTDNDDREWLIGEEPSEASDAGQGKELLGEFIPTFSSPAKSDSSWDDACDLYVSQSVEQQLKSRQQCRRSPRKALAGQGRKRKHSSSGVHNGNNASKKRKLKKKAKDKHEPEQDGMHTPTKKDRKNGSFCDSRALMQRKNGSVYDSEALMHLEKNILSGYTSPRRCQPSVSSSPLKTWNGDVREPLLQSPKRSRSSFLSAQPPPPFKIQ